MKKQKEYEVYLIVDQYKRKYIESVFFTGYTAKDVRKSLIEHDGYPANIVVIEAKQKRGLI